MKGAKKSPPTSKISYVTPNRTYLLSRIAAFVGINKANVSVTHKCTVYLSCITPNILHTRALLPLAVGSLQPHDSSDIEIKREEGGWEYCTIIAD